MWSEGGLASVLGPAPDLERFDRFTEQGLGEPLPQLDIGDQRHAMVDSGTPYHVVVGQFLLRGILRDVHYQIDFAAPDQIESVWTRLLQRPVDRCYFDATLRHECRGPAGAVQFDAAFSQGPCAFEKRCFGGNRTGAEEHATDRQAITDRQQRLEERVIEILSDA